MNFKLHPAFISILVLFCIYVSNVRAQPTIGSVYKEYSWIPEKYEILSTKGLHVSLKENIDLKEAEHAEIALEIANEHLGFDKIHLSINGNKIYPVLYPFHEQIAPSPSLWFHHWHPVIPISLSDLSPNIKNNLQLWADTFCFDGQQHPNGKVTPEHPNGEWGLITPWFPVYGITLRIYYNPAKKLHASGTIIEPAENSVVGTHIPIKISTTDKNKKVKQIDIIGKYEDINYEGDGIYYQWHNHLFKGKISHHIGTIYKSDTMYVWNTEWLPDQELPMEFAAIITDDTGLKYFTQPVKNIHLKRSDISVELCKPYEVPRSFTGCQYGTWIFEGQRTSKFYITGDLPNLLDARYVIASWGDIENSPGYKINNIEIDNKPKGENWYYNLSKPEITPISALLYGENIFSTIAHPGRMPDIYKPGAQVLIRYKKNYHPLVLFDEVLEWKNDGYIRDWPAPKDFPPSWTGQANYKDGRAYIRVEVLEKNNDLPMSIVCRFTSGPHKDRTKYLRIGAGKVLFSKPGVYYFSQKISETSPLVNDGGKLDWNSPITIIQPVLADINGQMVSQYEQDLGKFEGQLENYFPLKARYTVIIVPAGERFIPPAFWR